jgi:predicted NUDIX family NTP pyrophosphohydrolase
LKIYQMAKKSAGILVYRLKNKLPEVFLVHPGGPFYIKKDLEAWSIPKGEYEESEDPLLAAIREFREETGQEISGDFIELTPVTQKGGKKVLAWAVEGDIDENGVHSNTFQVEWPPRSGKMKDFPEVDRAAWFTVAEGVKKINPKQATLIEELVDILAGQKKASRFNKP